MQSRHIAPGGLLWAGLLLIFLQASAGIAQGDTWMVGGANVTSKLTPSLQTAEVEEMPGTGENYMSMKTEILKVKMETRCTGIEIVGAKLETEGRITSGSKGKFTGCTMYINGKLSPPCEPHFLTEKGVIKTVALKGVLSGGVLTLQPVEGTLLKTFEMSEECAVGEKIPVFGVLSLQDGNGIIATEKTTHLIINGPSTSMWVISNVPEHAVSLAGSAVLQLTGEHKGLTWSGLP